MIYKYNSNNDTKNKIKKYIMKHSSLFKLSSSLLYIRYVMIYYLKVINMIMKLKMI